MFYTRIRNDGSEEGARNMSELKQSNHKICNLTPEYRSAAGVRFMCKLCGRSVLYINREITKFTPYTLEEVRYYLFHKDWEWNGLCGTCEVGECEYLK